MDSTHKRRPVARVVLLGFGAINQRVAELLRLRESPAEVIGVMVRQPGRLPSDRFARAAILSNGADLAALAPDMVIEAASREAVREWGATALRTARRLVVSSASALVDDNLLAELKKTARNHGSQLVLSPGASIGIDALSAAARLGIREVRHRIIKSPESWSAAEGAAEPHHRAARLVLFEGSAREAARRFPLNANVTIVTALASVGLDHTTVELISDRSVTVNCHEVYVSGDFGAMTIKVENRPLRSNPKSSELAALALVRLVENETADLVM